MRRTLFGIVAVFAVGCAGGSGIGASSQADHIIKPVPAPCISAICDPVTTLDPKVIAEDWGAPELVNQIRTEIARLPGVSAGENGSFNLRIADPVQQQAVLDQLYQTLDQMAIQFQN
jgi:hypothetical protein